MHQLLLLLFLGVMSSSALAGNKVSVEQLEQTLAADRGKPDAEVAHQLAGLELTERLSTSRLQQLDKDYPGAAIHTALVMLADSSAFLAPPAAEIAADATPDAPTLRKMLDGVVTYVNKTVRQLPNFTAIRTTIGFEDSPAEDVLGQTGMTSYSYMPLHVVGTSSVRVVYRDRREELDASDKKDGKRVSKIQGLRTSGEFGPILSLILADAISGRITWSRWERGPAGSRAVFHFAVPEAKSHYAVQFCCTTDVEGRSNVYSQTAPYHGEIAFDPATGTILRIVAEAELPTGDVVSQAGMLVEYGPLDIGGKAVVCATRSVSLLRAHTTPQAPGAKSATNHTGEPKTFLNDVAFGQYHEFRAESRIVTGDATTPLGAGTADSPGGSPSRTPSH